MAWRGLLSKPTSRGSGSSAGSLPAASADVLPSVSRDYYLEHPAVAALTHDDAEAVRRKIGVRVHGGACPNPVSSFVQASFPQHVLDAVASAAFHSPTPIQRQAWPVAMRGLDLIGLAETGSGKTLAYLLPLLVHVSAQPIAQEGDGPMALVVAPTRELAVQIHEEAVRFGHPCGVRTACIVGGVPKGTQVAALRKAPEIVVATPGRLNDLLNAKRTELTHCTCLVLDEADRMLDLGFEPQVRERKGASERASRPVTAPD